MVQDPVCEMEIEEKDAFATRESMGQTFYFCSQACVEKFDANPHAYMHHEERPLASPLTTGVNLKLGDLRRVELPLVGLDSAASVPTIERELKAVTGVREATVNFSTQRAFIQFDAGHADLENLTGAIKRAGFRVGGSQVRIGVQDLRCAIEAVGYKTRPAASAEPEDKQRAEHEREYSGLMRKFWFAAIISIPVLVTAYPKFIPVVRDWSMATLRLTWIAAAILTLPVLFYSGGQFFAGAWAALKHRSANMNTLIALGTGAAWVYSTIRKWLSPSRAAIRQTSS